MLLKKSVFFSLILLLVPISVYPSSENSPSSKDRLSSLIPTKNGRDELVKALLSNFKKSAPEDLIKDIVELTNGYTITQVTGLVVNIISTSKENDLEQPICIDKLEEAINRIDTNQMKQQKLARLKEMACELFEPIPFNPDWFKEDVEPYEADPVFPTADERLKIIKEILRKHKKSASKFLIQKMLEHTEGHEMSFIREVVTTMVKSPKISSLDQERQYLECPTADERRGAVEEVLLLAEKSAPESLIEDIVELTEHYDIHTLRKLVRSMVKKSKTDSLDRNSCIEKLRKAIDLFDEDEVKKSKFAQIEAIISRESLPKTGNEQEATTSSKKGKKYPLLDDVFHPDKTIFSETAKQLKAGKFRKTFLRGILLYGPPGVGKDETVAAIVNESGCHIFTTDGSGLVGKYQGSGAEAIKSIFNQARAVEPGKGVIVLVDELQGIAPVTSDKNVGPDYKDHDNALTQLWLEYDRCMKEEHDNIMIIATCNQFDRIDERIRGRFNCIEFSYPDETGTYEILKNKSKHYDIPLSESELKEYAERMKGLCGRDLNKFIVNAKEHIRKTKNKAEALELSAAKLSTAKDNARPKEQPKKSWLGRAWDAKWNTVEFLVKNVGPALIHRAILGTTPSHGTSNYSSSGSVGIPSGLVGRNPALQALIEEQNRRRGQ